ncbi:hypothetical protein FHG87_008585 [Trinorchestia longiramus]|nr:hypothetical protein FHG87_008585 [Trinorchestia longiramus]
MKQRITLRKSTCNQNNGRRETTDARLGAFSNGLGSTSERLFGFKPFDFREANVGQEDPYMPGIAAKTERWYSCLCNRWVALAGAFVKLTLMLTIDWLVGLLTLVVAVLVYFYVGHAAPGLPPGLAGDFSFMRWVKLKCLICLGRAPAEAGVVIVAPAHPGVEIESSQLTEHNSDFAARSRYHTSEGGTAGPAFP